MTKKVRQIFDNEYKNHERIFNGSNETHKLHSYFSLKSFVRALYLVDKLTKSEYDNELDVIEQML